MTESRSVVDGSGMEGGKERSRVIKKLFREIEMFGILTMEMVSQCIHMSKFFTLCNLNRCSLL